MPHGNDRLKSGAKAPALLFYTHALVGGGAERVWAQTAAGLQERGYRVEFCVDWHAPENSHLLPPGMPVHLLGRNHALAIWRLRTLLATGQYSVAFSAVGASNLKLLLASVLSFSPTKTVISQHGFYEAEHRFLGKLGYRMSFLTSQLSAKTVVVSDALRKDLIERFGAAKRKTMLLYNAIDIGPSTRVPSVETLRARLSNVLAVGRLVPEKGHMDLLQALKILPDDVTLTIAGEGPERSRLEAAITSLGLERRVRLAGYLTDPAPLYAAAKVLALPSHTEAFGNVVVEAMGFGLPVVAADCGGPAEILGRGEFGRLVPVGDASAMAAALQDALADPGDPAIRRERAEAFSVARVLDGYEDLVLSLCDPPEKPQ
jgi:glycosyltransferase involved in cell wall biosynthesis